MDSAWSRSNENGTLRTGESARAGRAEPDAAVGLAAG